MKLWIVLFLRFRSYELWFIDSTDSIKLPILHYSIFYLHLSCLLNNYDNTTTSELMSPHI